MDSEEKKRYKTQFIVFRANRSQDPAVLAKSVLLLQEPEQKYFNKNDFIDNYLFVMNADKITMLIRQTTNAQPIRFLTGYGVTPEETAQAEFFCEFQTLLTNL